MGPLSLSPYFLVLLLLSNPLSSALDSIALNRSLSGNQTLTSKGGNFVLGFFQPGNCSYYYLGIWYNLSMVPQFTSVWLANREDPVTDPATAELKISADGNLVLSNRTNPRIWTTNATLTSNSTDVVLLDSGNLVLRARSNPNITLWQSFDHPTDTAMPGAVFGLNKVTGEYQSLISWKNIDDPSPGIFSHHINPNEISEYSIFWNDSYRYWNSGLWNGQYFINLPESGIGEHRYRFTYTSNATGNYFVWTGIRNIFTRLVMDVSGHYVAFVWSESISFVLCSWLLVFLVMGPLSLSPYFLVLLLLLSNQHSSALDSIALNRSLSGNQTLTSKGGNFVLGFFQPGNSSYYYLGIWYNLSKVPQFTSVWLANREDPVTDPATAELKISADGNLVLSNRTNPRIWSTNATLASNSTDVVLLDSGNLVLRARSNPNITLWQSFDHPTDTRMPGAAFGLNKVTGEYQSLISWKNIDDPSPGIFSYHINPSGISEYSIFWNDSYRYWNTGLWNGQYFSNIPEGKTHPDVGENIYRFTYTTNATGNYFTSYCTTNLFMRLVMDVSGHLMEFVWTEISKEWILIWIQPKLKCQVYALCGPFGSCSENVSPLCNCIRGFSIQSPSDWDLGDQTGGCIRNSLLQCGKNRSARMEKDWFYSMSNMRMPGNAQSLRVQSASDCELSCLENCSCTAYSYVNARCSVWYGDLLDLQEQYYGSGGGQLFIRLAASELPDSKANKGGVARALLICSVGGFIALSVFVCLLIWRRRRRRMMGEIKMVEGGLVAYSFDDLQHVTKNFSEKLGGGGFGSVFKGLLSDLTEVAVKKLEGLRQGEKQFRAEVSTIGTIHHVNLVRLCGFCSERIHKLLVYEYMPNGSLDTQLFRHGEVLDWKARYQIAIGIARGLTYLHEHCRDCIVHCDIKPENILLDASFLPKVADFGLAKLIGRDFSRVLTTMRGTIGYLAPEWLSGVAITAKADVYSYGMMLFEIISGKRNSDQTGGNKNGYFPILAACKLIEGDVISLLDSRLGGEADFEQVIVTCKVACWCIQDDENSRPSMGRVVQILEGVSEIGMPPIPRRLQMLADNPDSFSFFSE